MTGVPLLIFSTTVQANVRRGDANRAAGPSFGRQQTILHNARRHETLRCLDSLRRMGQTSRIPTLPGRVFNFINVTKTVVIGRSIWKLRWMEGNLHREQRPVSPVDARTRLQRRIRCRRGTQPRHDHSIQNTRHSNTKVRYMFHHIQNS